MKKILIPALGIAFFLTGCIKEEKKEDNSKTALLSKSWKWISAIEEYDYQPGVTYDEFATRPACDKDNYTTYSTNGSFNFYGGTLKCSPTESSPLSSGSWKFLNNETQLQEISGSYTFTHDIVELSATKLKVKTYYTVPAGKKTVTSEAVPQ